MACYKCNNNGCFKLDYSPVNNLNNNYTLSFNASKDYGISVDNSSYSPFQNSLLSGGYEGVPSNLDYHVTSALKEIEEEKQAEMKEEVQEPKGDAFLPAIVENKVQGEIRVIEPRFVEVIPNQDPIHIDDQNINQISNEPRPHSMSLSSLEYEEEIIVVKRRKVKKNVFVKDM